MNITSTISILCLLVSSCFLGAADKYAGKETKHHTNLGQMNRNERKFLKLQHQIAVNREKKAAKKGQPAEVQERKDSDNNIARKHAATVKALANKSKRFNS